MLPEANINARCYCLRYVGLKRHGVLQIAVKTLRPDMHLVGYPDELIAAMKQTWSPAQRDLVGRDGFMISAATAFPNRTTLDLPLPGTIYPMFSREAVEVHETLFREHRDLYGENVAAKLERGFALTDAEVEEARAERDRYRERITAMTADVDLVLTPTLETVAPPSGVGDLALREQVIRLTFPWSVAGAPALALPCGAAELGLPASASLVGPPGADGLVLAAGRLLEAALAG